MNTFCVTFTTPGRAETLDHVVRLNVPAADGRLTVLANHQPLLCALGKGELQVESGDGSVQTRTVRGGAMTVRGNRVEIVARE
jgi:F0F1-type ATP synthase epsilon subunit